MDNNNSRSQPLKSESQPTVSGSPVQRLIAGLVLLSTIVLAVGAFQIQQSRTQSLKQAETQSWALAETMENGIGAILQKTDLTLQAVCDEVVQQSTAGKFQADAIGRRIEMHFQRMPELDSLRITNAAGMVIIGSGRVPTKIVTISDRDYFQYLRDHPDAAMVISKPLIGKISGKTVVTCVRRITLADGAFGGVVYAVLPVDSLRDILQRVPVGKRGSVCIRRDDLALVVDYTPGLDIRDTDAETALVPETWQALLQGGATGSGTFTGQSPIDGITRIYSYHRIADFPLYINVGLALDDIFAEVRHEERIFAASLLLFVCLSTIVVRQVQRNWQKSVSAERELQRNYERLQLMQEVAHYHATTVQKLLDFSLEKVIALTDSRIGYIYHYSEEKEQFILNSWSRDVMAACTVAETQTIYDLNKTGLWGNVVRQRCAIMVNEYAAPSEQKKGYPEGHVPLTRFLSVPVFDNGRIVAVVGVANKELPYDLTDQLQLTLMMDGVWKIASRLNLDEQILRAGQEWQKTFDSISDSISIIDADQRIMRCNIATSLLLGREFSDIIGQPCWKLFHNAEAPIADCPMNRARISLLTETSTVKHGDLWLEVTVDPLLSNSGVLVGAIHIVRDVTERVTIENSLRESNDLFKLFMKHSPIYSFIKEITDSESRVLKVSDNYLEMTGITAVDMIGKTMHELFPADFADKITADDQQVVKVNDVLQREETINNRNYITYKFSIEQAEGKRLLAGYSIDITEQKKLEKTLQRQASILRGVLESTGSAVFSVNREFRYSSFNVAHADIMRALYNADIQLGSSIISYMTSEDAAVAQVNLARALAGESFAVEADSGDSVRVRSIFEISHHPIINERGDVDGVAVFARDIRERKQSEQAMREIQAQLMQNDKLATIGQLAAGVAHEINNPIGFVSSNMMTLGKYIEKFNCYIDQLEAELRSCSSGLLSEHIQALRQSLKLDYVMRDISVLIDENNEGIDRVKRIVQDLRTFSRADSSGVGSANLNSCMDSTINIVINEIKYSADLKREYAELPKVHCNAQQINQVFMNLLMNAAHAIQAKGEEVGEITVRSWSDQNNAFVSVSDNGCGIEPENQLRIFDAFYTTKEIGKGTGLGLSISAGIVRKHGGEITLVSEVGVGSTFTVRLPLKPPAGGKTA